MYLYNHVEVRGGGALQLQNRVCPKRSFSPAIISFYQGQKSLCKCIRDSCKPKAKTIKTVKCSRYTYSLLILLLDLLVLFNHQVHLQAQPILEKRDAVSVGKRPDETWMWVFWATTSCFGGTGPFYSLVALQSWWSRGLSFCRSLRSNHPQRFHKPLLGAELHFNLKMRAFLTEQNLPWQWMIKERKQ